jgi:hypothetical protein
VAAKPPARSPCRVAPGPVQAAATTRLWLARRRLMIACAKPQEFQIVSWAPQERSSGALICSTGMTAEGTSARVRLLNCLV